MIASFKLYTRRSNAVRGTEPEVVDVSLSVSDHDPLRAIDTMVQLLGTVREKYIRPPKPVLDPDDEDEEEEPIATVRPRR